MGSHPLRVFVHLCPHLKGDNDEGSGEDVELDSDVDGGGDNFLRRFTVPDGGAG